GRGDRRRGHRLAPVALARPGRAGAATAALNLRAARDIGLGMLTATVTDWVSTANDGRLQGGAAATVADVDHALARAAAGGDASAFEALYRRHAARIHGVVARLVGYDRARAEDLVQEAFVRAWQALPAYRFESAFGIWLHRLAVNTA